MVKTQREREGFRKRLFRMRRLWSVWVTVLLAAFVGASLLLKAAVTETVERRQSTAITSWRSATLAKKNAAQQDPEEVVRRITSKKLGELQTTHSGGGGGGGVCRDAQCRRVNDWMEKQLQKQWFSVASVLTRSANGGEAGGDSDAFSEDDVFFHIEAHCRLHVLAGEVAVSMPVQAVKFVSIPPLSAPAWRARSEQAEAMGGKHEQKKNSQQSNKGYLLLFHGCSHSAKDFCFASPERCPGCRALPEELRFVAAGLRMGLHVLAVSSSNVNSRCWTPMRRAAKMDENISETTDNVHAGAARKKRDAVSSGSSIQWKSPDHYGVLQVLAWAGALDDGNTLPIVAAGASSGGSFVASLPALLGARLVGIVVQIAARQVLWSNGAPDAQDDDTDINALRALRVVYSVLRRDTHTTAAALSLATKLAGRRGVHVDKVVTSQAIWVSPDAGVGFFSKAPSLVNGTAFSSRIPFFPAGVSQAVAAALLQAGLVLAESDAKKSLLLAADPRQTAKKWRSVVRPVLDAHLENMRHTWSAAGASSSSMTRNVTQHVVRCLEDSLLPDKSAISEVLNVLYAMHELFADDAGAMLRFLLNRA